MQPYSNTIYLYLVLFIFGIMIVHGEPEPMARPTRPEIFTSPEELRRYIDHVSDYYLLSGKARYGKRGNVLYSVPDVNYPWDTMKTVMENSQRSQQLKLEKEKQKDSQLLGEHETYGAKKETSRIDTRPCHVLDSIERYYDDVQ
ncbi:Neuropeptide Y [Apis cerana cerana]|uniref:Neuropeptide Y n=2 Tax=Apis cerana TaxID=7461 RepID=A0A2A3E8E2_APICC|nr:Neuropeptide Y [Apis cerana cerana]